MDSKTDRPIDIKNMLGHNIDPGGEDQHGHSNKDDRNVFRTRHKMAVIVPFRDRYTEMLTFVPHIHKYLNAKNIDHKIFVVNQIDDLQ